MELEFITRGGGVPFILGLDANKKPEEWDELMWGGKSFLEHLDAEIVTSRNYSFTCVDA